MVEWCRDADQAEALAMLAAVKWIDQLQLTNVILEGDNKTVAESLIS